MDVSVTTRDLAGALSRVDPPPNALVWLDARVQGESAIVLRYRTIHGYTRESRIADSFAHRAGSIGLEAHTLARIVQGGDMDPGRLRLCIGKQDTETATVLVDHEEDGSHYTLDTTLRRTPDPIEVPTGPAAWTGPTAELRRTLDEVTSRSGEQTWLETTPDGTLKIRGRSGGIRTRRTVQGERSANRWACRVPTTEARSCVAWLDGVQTKLWIDPWRLQGWTAALENDTGSRFELEAKESPPHDETTRERSRALDRIEVSSVALGRLDGTEDGSETTRWRLVGTRLHRGASRIAVTRERDGPLHWRCRTGELGKAAGVRVAQGEPRTVLYLHPDRIEVRDLCDIEATISRGHAHEE